MSDPNWAEILTGVGTVVLASSIFLTARQIRDQKRLTVANLLNEFSRRWDEPRLLDVRNRVDGIESPEQLRDVMLDYELSTPSLFLFYMRELNYFEELGLFHRESVVSTKMVDLMLGTVVRERWTMWKPTVAAIRARDGIPTYYEHFERLATRLGRRHRRRGRWRRFWGWFRPES